MRSGKILLGVLAGVAAGATLGILFAPDRGSNTRKKISDKSDDYADAMEEKFSEFIQNVKRQFNALKSDATAMADEASDMAEDVASNVTDEVNNTAKQF